MSSDDANRAAPVAFDDRMAIATPEGVEVELTLAGIGSRFIAALVDYTIQIVVIVAMLRILKPAGDAGAAIFASASFLMIFFYDVLFEVLGGGRTPGKRLNGLRVVRGGGRPVTLVRSAIRNILRLIDILPGVYAIGMTAIFISPRNQRVGDLTAGTYVIRDRYGDRRATEAEPQEIDAGAAATWDVSAVAPEDLAAVRAFLERRSGLRAQSRDTIARDLASRLRPRVGGVPGNLSDEHFLELLAAAKASRR